MLALNMVVAESNFFMNVIPTTSAISTYCTP